MAKRHRPIRAEGRGAVAGRRGPNSYARAKNAGRGYKWHGGKIKRPPTVRVDAVREPTAPVAIDKMRAEYFVELSLIMMQPYFISMPVAVE
jgi:hypothetical protein